MKLASERANERDSRLMTLNDQSSFERRPKMNAPKSNSNSVMRAQPQAGQMSQEAPSWRRPQLSGPRASRLSARSHWSRTRMKRVLCVFVLSLSLDRALKISFCFVNHNQDQQRTNSQHKLTKYYHDIQQNESYKRHDWAQQTSSQHNRAPAMSHQAEISLRPVLVPVLLGARQANGASRGESAVDFKSANNRGPANRAPLGLVPQSGPFERQPRFGQRRRSSPDSSESLRPLLASGRRELRVEQQAASKLAKKSAGWSQPDPRRSYSLPVSIVKVATGGGGGGGGGASKRSSSQAIRQLLSSAGIGGASSKFSALAAKRNEPFESAANAQDSTVSSSTQANESSTSEPSSLEANESENELAQEHGLHEPTQQKAPPTKSSADRELERKGAIFGTRRGANGRHSPKSQEPMVTLIRYVPVAMNVPAAQVAVIANNQQQQPQQPQQHLRFQSAKQLGELGLSSSTVSPHLLEQLYRQQAESSSSQALKHHGHTLAPAKYQLIDSLLAPTKPQTTAAGQQLLVEHPSGDMSSDYSHLYPASSLFQLDQQPAAFLAANGHQLTRLAYVPVGQPQLAVPSSQATSKALSAYASRLIAMLRPSSLLASIGASNPLNHQQQQQQQQALQTPALQHIYLLTPAEPAAASSATNAPAGLSANGRLGAHPMAHSTNAPAKPEDTLLNQASKLHSTKSQRQPSSSQLQPEQAANKWPLSPQMNGLVCIQGMINAKQSQQQQQPRPMSQSQLQDDDLGSFEYERPQSLELETGKVARAKTTPRATKSAKGGREQARKMSPIKLMQKVASSKALKGAGQRAEKASAKANWPAGADDEQDQQARPIITQQRLLLGSSSHKSAIFDEQEQEQGAQPADSHTSRQTNNDNDENNSDNNRRTNIIIPFTIRDKIDVPSGAARANRRQHSELGVVSPPPPPAAVLSVATNTPHAAAQTNGPVQYDEPSESELNLASRSGTSADRDQRRSRTSFVSSARPIAPVRQLTRWGGAQFSTLIDYKKESQADLGSHVAGQRGDYSLPVLMASSSPSSAASAPAPAPAPVHNGKPEEANDRTLSAQDESTLVASYADDHRTTAAGPLPPTPTPTPPPPPPFSGIQGAAVFASHEQTAASSVPTTTTTAASASLQTALELATSSPAPFRLAPTLARPTSAHDQDKLGQLISSISLATDRPNGSSTGATLELPASSTPRDSSASSTRPSNADQDYFVTQNVTASPLFRDGATSARNVPIPPPTTTPPPPPEQPTTAASPRVLGNQDEETSSAESEATNTFFSHDRTLASLSANSPGQFGKISESLQTNPLDLIDLQNSRSSFELPAQLESLSMLYGGGGGGLPQQQSSRRPAAVAVERVSSRSKQAAESELSEGESVRHERRAERAPSARPTSSKQLDSRLGGVTRGKLTPSRWP